MAFDPRFELDVLAEAASDPRYRKRAHRLLIEHAFIDPRHTWMWNILDRLGPEDKLTPRVAAVEIRRLKEADRLEYMKFVTTVLDREVNAKDVALEQLKVFRDTERIRGAMAHALDLLDSDALNAEDVSVIRAALREGVRSSDSDSYEYQDYYESWAERQAERKRLRDNPSLRVRIPTKFMKTLDHELEGGLEPHELGLIVGTTGRGKSVIAVNIALGGARSGAETVYLGTEMRVETNVTRADASLFDTEYKRFRTFDFSAEDLELLDKKWRAHKELRKKLRFASTPMRGCTIESVNEILDHTEDDWGESVKLFVFDSGDHMRPSERVNSRRERESEGYVDIKSLTTERGMATWSTSHAPKEVVDKIASAENIGESYDKSRLCDVFVSANQTELQRTKGLYRMRVGKNRQGSMGAQFLLQSTLSKITFEEVPEGADADPDDDDDPDDEDDDG